MTLIVVMVNLVQIFVRYLWMPKVGPLVEHLEWGTNLDDPYMETK